MSARLLKIATAAYPLSWLGSWQDYEDKAETWVKGAAEDGADIAVFPEYGGMEIASLDGSSVTMDLRASIDAVSARHGEFKRLWQELSSRYGVSICAPTIPYHQIDEGRVTNRAYLFLPSGRQEFQDKLIMTRFERDEWGISGGDEVKVFDTPIGVIGMPICYDSEFPLISRAMANAGATILLVPSVTETAWGYNRVKIGAMARALENQCVVVQAPLVGEASWSPATDISIGAAGIYGPPDIGFPENGVLAIGKLNEPGWVMAEIDPEKVSLVRENGTVLNHHHWSEQDDRLATPVRIDMRAETH